MSEFLFPLAKKFIGGTTLKEALRVINHLQRRGFLTRLDLLGESAKSPSEAMLATQRYIEALQSKNILVQLTQMGLDFNPRLCQKNLFQVASVAQSVGGRVTVDEEGSSYAAQILEMVKEVHAKVPVLSLVLHAHLRRAPEDAIDLLRHRVHIHLTKGDGKEPLSIALQDPTRIDQQYGAVMKRLLTSGQTTVLATQDETIIQTAIDFAEREKISSEAFEFQFPYGLCSKLSARLVRQGWRVRWTVPCGPVWIPYAKQLSAELLGSLVGRVHRRVQNLFKTA